MPIYEYFCHDCNVIFNFMSVRIAPAVAPICPRCASQSMKKYLSSFSTSSAAAVEKNDEDEQRVNDAFNNLLDRAEKLTDSDAGEVSSLMHSFTKECGVEYTEKLVRAVSDISKGNEQRTNAPLPIDKDATDSLLKSSSKGKIVGELTKKAEPELDPRIYQL